MSLEGLLLKIMIDEIGGNILPPVGSGPPILTKGGCVLGRYFNS
jgi:hypothetical protein